ncbi:hypothetical protein [Micromonospora sp. KC721]|uniref:hypothetical protein n=1 Tax=Micromonospora sp. KC721 TaxID=2530380 RepID=UPI00104AF20F|nr:hypothetical protein [Micromonospora sp. KC721]TDB80951.1 hypothetical protein E1182_07050 [Micromonospora sp. KC721]
MRDGQLVTVRALAAMPGVTDGEVRHGVEWTPRLATLVDAGRYEVLDGGDVDQPETAAAEPATAVAGDVDGEEPPPEKRSRRR